MSILLGILLTLAILTVVVFIHEMGHFLMARVTGMRVEEFGIGIPPKARQLFTDKEGTDYTLNWLPIGGFVRIKGEDPGSDDADAKDAFSNKKWWARSLVLIAGVTMNFVLAWIIFSALIWQGSSPLSVNALSDKEYGSYFLPAFAEGIKSGYIQHEGVNIVPVEGGVAYLAGVGSGDTIIGIDDKNIASIDLLIEKIRSSRTLTLKLRTQSGGIYEKSLTPEEGKIGAYLSYKKLKIDKEYHRDTTLIGALSLGAYETLSLSHMTLDILGKTLRNLISPRTEEDREEAKKMIAGPIGMGAGIVSLVEIGLSWKLILLITALLSVNLGVLNILPFPALDGGRLVSTSVMSLAGIFTKKKGFLIALERWVHGLGMIFLIVLSLFIAFLDILKL